jgi:hypothetical protein
VQLDGSARLPSLDGSLLTNLSVEKTAADITLDTTAFDNVLSSAHTTVQAALETLDEIIVSTNLSGHSIQEEGTPVVQRANLNFVGDAVSVVDDSENDSSVVTVNLPATGSGLNFGTWDSSGTFATGVRFDGTDDKVLIPIATSDVRSSTILLQGELLYDTDENTLYYGDGVTPGGNTYDVSAKLESSSVSSFALTYLSNTTAEETLTTLGVSSYIQTLLGDTTAASAQTTLGISAFAQTLLDDATADGVLTTLGVSTFAQTLLDDVDASATLTTLGVSPFAQTLLDDTTADEVLTTLGVSTYIQTLLDDTMASASLTTLGVSAFAQTLLDDNTAGEVLTTLGVSAFAQTLLDDTAANGVLTTLGISAFAQTLLDDSDSSTALNTLGISAFAQTLLNDTTAAESLTTLGISAFAQTLLDDVNASAALTTLGAASLASPTFTGTPTAPTAAVNNNTTQLATTAFVQTQIAAPFTRTITAIGALNIDCSLGNYFTKTISSNSTFTFSNVPSGVAYAFTLEVTHSGGTITWPTSVKWSGDIAPSLTTSKRHMFVFVTSDGGTRWRGSALVDFTN